MTNSGMYKNLASKIWLTIMLFWISLPVFASVNVFDILEKEINNINPISKISNGKLIVGDLFSKNLELIKNNEIKITNQTIENIRDFYTSRNCFLKKKDIFNIIMNSNNSVLYTLESILIEKSTQNIWNTPTDEINKSYQKFFNCKKEAWEITNYKSIQDVENEINWLYSKLVDNEYKLETINQSNYWEDFFRNWDTEDSSFDILADIYNIWHILMPDFKKQVKLYFYNLPNNDNSDSNLSFNNIIWKKLAANTTETLNQKTESSNAEINNFISNTNQTETEDSSYENTNQCINTSSENSTVETKNTEENTDYDWFLSWVENFISNANIDEKINEILTDKFKEETKIEWDQKDTEMGKNQKQNNKTEEFIEKNIVMTNSCSNNCLDKESVWEQTKCELDCSLSCFEKCEDIKDNAEKISCKAQCVCFMVSWPKEPILSWLIEADIYKIKFCKVPVSGYKIQRNKTVESIGEIFSEMWNVFNTLRDSWQMIKNKQTKEFLELPVELNFSKIFSFALNVNRKKIPNTKQTRTISDQKIKESKAKKSETIDAKTENNEKDNYNKYIIMQSLAWNSVNSQSSNSITERINQLKEQQSLLESSNTKSEDTIKNSQNNKTISLSLQLETFLADNISFWKEFQTTISDANDISDSLKQKIQSSE